MNRRFYTIFILVFCCVLGVYGQKSKYNIKLTVNNINEAKLYLQGYCGGESFIADSAKVKKSTVNFKCPLEPGFYDIVNRNGERYWSVIANESKRFSIVTDTNYSLATTISNSSENEFYFNFLLQLLNTDQEKERSISHNYATQLPNNLVTQMIAYNYFQKYGQRPYNEHYFDSVKLTDAMLHFPSTHAYIAQFFNENIADKSAAAQIQKVDLFFSKCDVKSEIGQYYLKWLLKHYLSDFNPEWDVVFVYIYEKYFEPNGCKFLTETNARIMQKNVVRKKRVLNGSTIPFLQITTADGKSESTEHLQRTYTIIWFWDPDCDDCLIETPALQEYYAENADKYDFEVFAVALTEDVDRWKNTVNAMGLTWINSCDGAGVTNYDFRDYFNILTTPASFLIDKNHKIILQQITLEKLDSFFENNN